MISGADHRVKSAFRATLRREGFFGLPYGAPLAPEVLPIEDLRPAIARAEAAIRASRREPTPLPPRVAPKPMPMFETEASTGPSGTQRIRRLPLPRPTNEVSVRDSILVLDEYAFNYPAGRLDMYLGPEDTATRRPVARRAIVGFASLAIGLPLLLAAIFAAGLGIGSMQVDAERTTGSLVRLAPASVEPPPVEPPAAAALTSGPLELESRPHRSDRAVSSMPRR